MAGAVVAVVAPAGLREPRVHPRLAPATTTAALRAVLVGPNPLAASAAIGCTSLLLVSANILKCFLSLL
jgi:hypothetical protein